MVFLQSGLSGIQQNKRLVIGVLLVALIAVSFWSQSRVPDLNDKALMGGATQLEDPLSFEAAYPVNLDDPAWKRITLTTINWLLTNRNGMTFGVLFGAAFLSMLRYLPRRSFRNGYANAALGFVMGAPLGVCVNCAAPIARGLHAGGARLETTLAAMIASPTFNVIVLTMLISLFPFYIVAIKIVLTMVVILIAIPLICRLLPPREIQIPEAEVSAFIMDIATDQKSSEKLGGAFIGYSQGFLRDLWFIIRTTVPLMVVAGFLGATVATLAPVGLVQEFPVSFAAIAAFVLLGLFLPVPIAFDVVAAASIYATGAPVEFVMPLLFTLGIFSIYSYMIVARSISFRAASFLAVVIAVLGIASGYMAKYYQERDFERGLEVILGSVSGAIVTGANAAQFNIDSDTTGSGTGSNIQITSEPFAASAPTGDKPFTRIEAWKIGIDRPNLFSMGDMTYPFMEAPGSISAADIDNDGDADIVLADNHGGIHFYANDGSGKFNYRDVGNATINKLPVLTALPADVNNDGWIDLVFSTFTLGEYVALSRNGDFSESLLEKLPNRKDARFTHSMAVGDINRDGYLDVVLGNHSALPTFIQKGEYDRNRVLLSKSGDLAASQVFDTSGLPGETLTLLLSDIDQDGHLDMVEGNDFTEPDVFYLGNGLGGFDQISASDGLIPYSTLTTMSIKSADLNNDLKLELYLSQIAGRTSGVSERLKLRSLDQYCVDMERDADREKCDQNIKIRKWYSPNIMRFSKVYADQCNTLPENIRWECRSLMLRNLAFRSGEAKFCDRIPAAQYRIKILCDYLMAAEKIKGRRVRGEPVDQKTGVYINEEDLPGDIPQHFGGNVLLTRQEAGSFVDIGPEAGVDIAGWSWDVKIFDFDNDGLQDIHIMNGDWGLDDFSQSNLFLRNNGGLKFSDATEENGLVDYLIVTSSAAADFDNDGDIDQVVQTVNGPLIAYLNNSQTGNSVAFQFRDHIGNRYGVGNKLTIHYGDKAQIRELKMSGGFSSFDSPVLHFGLGSTDRVDRIVIEWSTGGMSEVSGPFEANARYTIDRR